MAQFGCNAHADPEHCALIAGRMHPGTMGMRPPPPHMVQPKVENLYASCRLSCAMNLGGVSSAPELADARACWRKVCKTCDGLAWHDHESRLLPQELLDALVLQRMEDHTSTQTESSKQRRRVQRSRLPPLCAVAQARASCLRFLVGAALGGQLGVLAASGSTCRDAPLPYHTPLAAATMPSRIPAGGQPQVSQDCPGWFGSSGSRHLWHAYACRPHRIEIGLRRRRCTHMGARP